MDVDTFKLHVPRLGRHAFSTFVTELFNIDAYRGSFGRFEALAEAGEDVFFLPYLDSYGSSIHNVYLLHFPPLELFSPQKALDMRDPVLLGKLSMVRKIYKGRKGRWGMVDPYLKNSDALLAIGFITNLAGISMEVYERTLIPAYDRLKTSSGLRKPKTYVGSCDSFLDKNRDNTLAAFDRFVANHTDGIAISLTQYDAHVATFTSERNLSAGVLSGAALPYEPTFLAAAIGLRDILEEFDRLLEADAPEGKLEEFLVANYRLLFGFAYDRIETQLWLRCPEVDLGNRTRRLDLFLRNSVTNDWDLIEIKRAVPLTRTARDVPTISRHLVEAMQQVKNYARLLSQDKVKRHFAHQGIEYFEPRVTIVIGRTPAIPPKQWRWLRTSNEGTLTITTFDELRKELALRLTDRYELLNQVRSESARSTSG